MEWHEESKPPPPIPISESDNPDAIALRATLGILQLQRKQASNHLTQLERQRKIAISDPRAFAAALARGGITSSSDVPLEFTDGNQDVTTDDPNEEDNEAMDHEGKTSEAKTPLEESFGNIPGLQKVVRCPPINWAKYHVVGEALDSMHEEQRRQPSSNIPNTEESDGPSVEDVIAAPYDPWSDRSNGLSTHTHQESG